MMITKHQSKSTIAARLAAIAVLSLSVAACTEDGDGGDGTDGTGGTAGDDGTDATGGTTGPQGTESADDAGSSSGSESGDTSSSGGSSESGDPVEAELEILVQGAALVAGANGMFFDAEDQLYVANAFGQSISVLNPDDGEVIGTLGPAQGAVFPDDLTFAPDGTLYWTDIIQGQVFGLTTDDTLVSVAEGIPSANPITVSDDGRLFVAQCFDPVSNGIFEVDLSGAEAPRLIVGDVMGCASNGMDWHDGFLYAPQWFNGRVVRVDVETGDLTEVTTGWPVPAAVKFDSAGQLHAVSYASGEVVQIDVDTGARTVLAQLPVGLDNLAFDSDDRLFVSSAIDGFVVEVLDDGSTEEVSPGGMVLPMGLALLGDNLWVGEGLALRNYDVNTGDALDVVPNILGVGPFASPPGNVTALDDTRLLLLDTFSGGAAIFDTTTGMVQAIDPFATPADAELYGEGVAVTEVATGRVVVATGPLLSERVSLVEGLTTPTGLAADGDNLYVSEVATGMVLQVVSEGEVLPSPEPVTEAALNAPEGMTIRAGGHLVVVEAGAGALQEIDLSSGESTSLATELSFMPPLPGLPPFQFLNDVIVDDDDVLYINGDGAAVIYELGTPADD